MDTQDGNQRGKKVRKIGKAVELIISQCVKKGWKYTSNPWNDNSILRCYIRLEDNFGVGNVSDGRLADYLVYQIYRLRDRIESDHTFNVTWLFGETAVSKFISQYGADGKSGINYYIDRWLNKGSLNRWTVERSLQVQSAHSLAEYIHMTSEETTKKRFHNKVAGFTICVGHTTGWDPQSVYCSQCKFADQCRTLMKKKYPELIRLREEEGRL